MSNGYGGLGQPGERLTGQLDAKTQNDLIVRQGLTRAGVDFVTFLAALLCGFALGRWGIWVAASFMLWMVKDRVGDWFEAKAFNPRLTYLMLLLTTDAAAVFYTAGLLVLVCAFIPYQWGYDFALHQSWLIILHNTTLEWIDKETLEPMTRIVAANTVIRFPLLLRVILMALPAVLWCTTPIVRRRLGFELQMPSPAMAERYSEVGTPDKWGPKPAAASPVAADTVTIEVTEVTENGRKVVAYPDLHHRPEVRRAFVALNAQSILHLSWRNIRDLGIGQDTAKAIMSELYKTGFIRYPVNEAGKEDKNQPCELTPRGRGLAGRVAEGAF